MRIAHVEKHEVVDGCDMMTVFLEEVTPVRDGVEYKDAIGNVDLSVQYNDECGLINMGFEYWEFNIGDDVNNVPFKMEMKDLEKMRGKIYDKVGMDLGCFL
jgi:hypothetical protein